MAGIYIHVPFCATRCSYCAFFSTTEGLEVKERYVAALIAELEARRTELTTHTVSSIYLGGGTPSQLSPHELNSIFTAISRWYSIEPNAEITLEANPDDITPTYIEALKTLPINRISLGCQSSNNEMLRMLNRRHSFEQAVSAIHLIVDRVTTNVSIDLMYGLPNQTLEMFETDIKRVLSLPITHLSAYALSIEQGTALYKMLEKGKIQMADDELYLSMYQKLIDYTKKAGMEHYEISNFAFAGSRAVHNSSYWNGSPYLGCGPGAHSYNGKDTRRWNNRNLKQYIQNPNKPPFESEHLTPADCFNDFVMTSLRTCDGLNLNEVAVRFGNCYKEYASKMASKMLETGSLSLQNNILKLTRKGLFVSDDVMSELFFIP